MALAKTFPGWFCESWYVDQAKDYVGGELLIDKNRLVIIKTDKISLIRYLWFTENQSITIQNFQFLRNFEK
jgi:hypothetical protein